MSDYLFDGSGPPDPEIAELERALAPLAYKGAAPKIARRSPMPFVAVGAAAAAAALVLVWPAKKPMPPKAGWALAVLSGTATIDHHVVATNEPLALNEWLETGAGHARLDLSGLGTVELGPGSRARVVASSPLEVELSMGKLIAHIKAPPRQFAVKLPHARVVDLGCAFTIELDEDGHARVVVTEGAVAIDDDASELTVPSGQSRELDANGHALGTIPAVPVVPHPQKPTHPHVKVVPLPTHTPIGPGDEGTPTPSMRNTFREHGL